MSDLDVIFLFVDATENVSDERRILLAITVEIDDGCMEHIQLKEGDSAEAVAMKFCQAHALPEQFVAPLTEHIVSNIISLRCVVITETFVVVDADSDIFLKILFILKKCVFSSGQAPYKQVWRLSGHCH